MTLTPTLTYYARTVRWDQTYSGGSSSGGGSWGSSTYTYGGWVLQTDGTPRVGAPCGAWHTSGLTRYCIKTEYRICLSFASLPTAAVSAATLKLYASSDGASGSVHVHTRVAGTLPQYDANIALDAPYYAYAEAWAEVDATDLINHLITSSKTDLVLYSTRDSVRYYAVSGSAYVVTDGTESGALSGKVIVGGAAYDITSEGIIVGGAYKAATAEAILIGGAIV